MSCEPGHPKQDDRPVILALLAVAGAVLVLAVTEAACGDTGSNCPAFVKDYQNGLGALIGFAGVIVTLAVNARLGRKQSERTAQLAREQADYTARLAREQTDRQFAQEQRHCRAAFKADLGRIKDAIEQRVGLLSKPISDKENVQMFARHAAILQDQLMDKLLLLTSDEIGTVMVAYAHIRLTGVSARQIKVSHGVSLDGDTEESIRITEVMREPVLVVYRTVLTKIEASIKALTGAQSDDP